MSSGRPNLSVVLVVSVCAAAFGIGFQSLGNWIFRGSPAVSGDEVMRAAILSVVVAASVLFIAARSPR
jgi:ABC-type proline/glycine betaine transport system permease subunit